MGASVLMLWLLALAACVALASPPTPPLLIVGDVTASTARVLVSGAFSFATVFVRTPQTAPPTYSLVREIALEPATSDAPQRPRVLPLDGLVPGSDYVVAFRLGAPDEREETVRFRTPHGTSNASPSAATAPTRVLVVSCDRFVDDGDDALWLAIERDLDAHADSYVGVAHIGDQVYVDAGAARVPIRAVSDETTVRVQYNAAVAQFRAVYYATLGRAAAQRVLRRGAHWMLPDDHEVINNLNTVSVDRVLGKVDPNEAPPTSESQRRGMELHYRAGLQVLYEFQYQLRRDVAWDHVDFLEDPLDQILAQYPLYFGVEFDRLKLFFLDVRFDRSFTLRTPHDREQLVSPRQQHELQRSLSRWSSDPDSSIVVLAAMPLFFHSRLTANIVYAVEKELYPGHPEHAHGLRALYDIFDAFLQSPNPALRLLVGGDVHTLAHTRVCGVHSRKCIDQLVTSGLTNGSTAINDAKLVPFYLLILRLYPLYDWLASLVGLAPAPWVLSADRVFLGRNYGVLEMEADGGFEWRNSVVLDHDTVSAVVTQVLFDWIGLLVGAASLLFVLSRACTQPQSRNHGVKDRKTE